MLMIFFMKIAELISTKATCPRKSVGCVITKDNRIISTGYNGSPRGMKHCDDIGCKIINNHCQRVLHAEMNALLFAGRDAEGATLYSNVLPCVVCFKLLIQAGIKRVVYEEDYNKKSVEWLIKESGMVVERFINNK